MTRPQRFDYVRALWKQYLPKRENAARFSPPALRPAQCSRLGLFTSIWNPDHYIVDCYRGYSILCAAGAYFYWTGSGREFETVEGVREDIDMRIAITISAHFD